MPATKKSNPELGPTVFVLFGATGDLAKRLVLPAFHRLAQEDLLPKQWLLVGNGRGDVAHEDFRKHVRDALTEFADKPAKKEWKAACWTTWPRRAGRWAATRSSCTTWRCRRWRSRS
jgi:glucose-6-phosphate 1-dehydrogenase